MSKALDLVTRVRGVRGAMLVSEEDGLAVAEQLDPLPDVFNFQQSEYDVDNGNQRKAQRGRDPSRDPLRRAQQPGYVKMLGPERSNRYAVTFKPRHRGFVERLATRRIGG